MKLTKKAQYGLLFALYLSRSGMSNTKTISENLNLSTHFLEQVARALRMAGIIKATRGPGGGYSLVGNPTVGDVLAAVGVGPMITKGESMKYAHGATEERMLNYIVGGISLAMSKMLRTPVAEAGGVLVRDEVAQLNSASSARPN